MGQMQTQAWSLRRSELLIVAHQMAPLNCTPEGVACCRRLPCLLSDRRYKSRFAATAPLSCLPVLSVTLVTAKRSNGCGQTVGWIKMPLGTKVGLGSGDTVLDGDPAHHTERATAAEQPPPHFSPHFALALSPVSATAELFFFERHV